MTFSLTSTFEDEFEYRDEILSLELSFDNVLRTFLLFSAELYNYVEKIDFSLENLLSAESNECVKSLQFEDKHALFLYIMKEFLDMDLENPNVNSSAKKVYDFEQDAGLIYASFLHSYNMDLYDQQGKLHWKKFIKLFDNLPEKSEMKKVIGYRGAKIPAYTKYNKDERAHLLKMKEIYKLKQDNSEASQEAQIVRNERNFEMLALAWKKK